MRYTKIKRVIALVVLLIVAGVAPAARANINYSAQDLPTPTCDNIQVPAGNKVTFRVFAVGVQRYRWNGAGWDFVEPVATLYADSKHNVKVGSHYAGPTWDSILGGKVVATRLQGCSPDPTAIPWLLLQATSADGVLSPVTYIQRVNTKGGLTPTAAGATIGALADVPYTTDYYFYRGTN